MGHVPPRPIPRTGPGPHLPRRQRGETREDGAEALSRRRALLGAAGERFAAWWLTQQGLSVISHNIATDGGEVDLLMRDGSARVVVEVRTIGGQGDPIDAVDRSKRSHVRRLAGRLGATRVDYIGVGFRPWGVEVHWVPG